MKMGGIVNVIVGLVMLGGAMSGKLVFRGTTSSTPLGVIGVVLIGVGIYRIVQNQAGNKPPDDQSPPQP